MVLSTTQSLLGLASGMLVGFSLGLVGGGGSILAVPLMVYVVGVPEPHVAIGTSAIAVATNAAINLTNHARGGTVIWSCALVFAAAGIAGAFGEVHGAVAVEISYGAVSAQGVAEALAEHHPARVARRGGWARAVPGEDVGRPGA